MSKSNQQSNLNNQNTKQDDKLVEVTALKTFQCLMNGEALRVVQGKTAKIPEPEAQAAKEAGLIK